MYGYELNTGLDGIYFKLEENAPESILSLVLEKRSVSRITGFRVGHAVSDAPGIENWYYTYIVIHIGNDVYIVQAYRAYLPQVIYQRLCVGNSWSGNWFVFEGKSL